MPKPVGVRSSQLRLALAAALAARQKLQENLPRRRWVGEGREAWGSKRVLTRAKRALMAWQC